MPRRPGARAVPCGREESPQRSGNAARGGAGAAAPLPARSGAGARPYPAGRELRALEVLQRLSEGNRRGGRARGAPQPCREAGSGSDPHGALSAPRVIPDSRRRNPWLTRGKRNWLPPLPQITPPLHSHPSLPPSQLVPVPDWISSRASHSSWAWRCSSLIPARGKGCRSQIWGADTDWGLPPAPSPAQDTLGLCLLFARGKP